VITRITLVLIVGLLLIAPAPAPAQAPATVEVHVRHDAAPVAGAQVVINGSTFTTDAAGAVTISLPSGPAIVTALMDGFVPTTTSISLQPGQTLQLSIDLDPQPTVEETMTVSATRTGARLEDQPMRVEVLVREEIEEKMLMTPGDIVMMLNEMGGMRVQTTSPSLGAASVRIQGMRGRYTRFFSDGLPLFGEVGGLGLLQIPPMDLGQVEVIKGVASSLYGAGAMGGVVNLISRRPGSEEEREFLVNRTALGGTDIVGWYATPANPGGWALTLLGGGHWQSAADTNDDAWADLPGYSRAVVRPRVFWDDGEGRSFFATVGFTAEDREGGTIDDLILPAAGGAYREALETRRVDGGAVAQVLIGQRYLVSARGAISRQRHDHRFGEIRERDRHDTAFGEVTIRAMAGRHTLVAGVALERDAYRPRDVPRFAYTFVVPGVFGQADVELTPWFSLSGSGRLDHHSEYGTFFSPRAAALFRSGQWSSRLSIGTGFFGPSPLTEETEASGLSRLVIPRGLRAETGRSASFDVSRTDGPLSYTVTIFGSRIAHPINVDRSTGSVLSNLPEPASNVGLELLGTLRREPYALTGTYTYVRSREIVSGQRRDAALTPRHSAGVVGMWEREDAGRVGVELYYTGAQTLEENPYRTLSSAYVVVGLLAERRLGRFRLFVNGENLTGVRQTRWDPLIRPERAADGRWTVDAWAPLEGRNINGGLRVEF
jgi:iron complex outermembrane receptor protein